MNAEPYRSPVHRIVLRVRLSVLLATAVGVGLWALFLPHTFYEDFPLPGRDRVSILGHYNENLMRDYGELNFALGVLLLFAAVLLEKRARASLAHRSARLRGAALRLPHHADAPLLPLR